jgi:hypothetical protein
MKKLYLLNLLLILLVSCSEFKSEELKEANLRGKIKSVKSEKFYADEKFGEVVKTIKAEIDEDDEIETLFANSHVLFDINGSLESISNFLSNGKLKHKIVREETVMNYFDASGDLQFVVKFDNIHHPVESNIYSSDGNLISKIKQKYNDKKQAIEMNTYDAQGVLQESTSYTYENDRIESRKIARRQESYWSDSDFIEITENIKYNEKSDMNERDIVQSSKTISQTFEYIYDSKNNWIKRIQFTAGKPAYIIEREIEYY